jgi:hypothetical protein
MVEMPEAHIALETRSGLDVFLSMGMLLAALIVGVSSIFTVADQIAVGILLIVLLCVLLRLSSGVLVCLATVGVIALLSGEILGPHIIGAQSLLKATTDIQLWPYVLLSLFLAAFAHHHNTSSPTLLGVPRTLSFLISTLFYGFALVLAVQAGFAAWGLESGQSIWAITRHAFAAETPIHTVVLSLWFGLMVRSIMRIQSDRVSGGWAKRAASAKVDYSHIEAISRLLPMLGFLGTVIGLAAAVASISGQLASESALGTLALATLFKNLAIKFETSLLGLMGTITMSVFLSMIEARQRWNSDRYGEAPKS